MLKSLGLYRLKGLQMWLALPLNDERLLFMSAFILKYYNSWTAHSPVPLESPVVLNNTISGNYDFRGYDSQSIKQEGLDSNPTSICLEKNPESKLNQGLKF